MRIQKRAILLTENEEPIFRYDVKINGRNFVEYDVFNALSDMDKAGIINLKKIFNMLKVRFDATSILDTIDMAKEVLITKKDTWKIIPEDENKSLIIKNNLKSNESVNNE